MVSISSDEKIKIKFLALNKKNSNKLKKKSYTNFFELLKNL